jgi:FMN-dependent NADH-azoreductase
MAKLLYIECSPRKQISASIEVCRAFLDAYRTANPAETIQTLDIWDLAMPEFNGDALAAKYAGLALASAKNFATQGFHYSRIARILIHVNDLRNRIGG